MLAETTQQRIAASAFLLREAFGVAMSFLISMTRMGQKEMSAKAWLKRPGIGSAD
jgi:hypothetical protein